VQQFREFNIETDFDDVFRVWLECGWIKQGEEEHLKTFIGSQRAWVAEVNDSAECLVLSAGGDIRYLDKDLPLSCISAVTTSHIARKQGLAGRLTAHVIALDAMAGAFVSTLGIFEQGYYNNLGYGNGSYEHIVSFHPSHLRTKNKPRVPIRLKKEDTEDIHKSRLNRLRRHGSCNLYGSNLTEADMKWAENSFGMGYYDGPDGELTHYIWFTAKNLEQGPYNISWMSYRNYEQFIELMGLMKGLGDQVKSFTMKEPPGIQMQDLLEKPFKYRSLTRKSDFEQSIEAMAYWQMRICNLEGCLSKTSLPGGSVKFNLKLTDPIEEYLDPDIEWRGIGGDYVITLGTTSRAEKGTDNSLSTLEATVNAFTRLWLGISPATSLSVTDDLLAPQELLKQLDQILRLPRPAPDWDY
jgi:predicted acetyltransferase